MILVFYMHIFILIEGFIEKELSLPNKSIAHC